MSAQTARILAEAIQKHQQGQLDEAAEWYRGVLALDAANIDAMRLLSMIHEGRGEFEPAIALARQAVGVSPKTLALHLTLAGVLLSAGQAEEALKIAQESAQRDKRNVDALLLLGDAYQQTGDFAGAIASYRKGLQLDRNIPELYNNLGNALLASGDPTHALSAYRQAIDLNPRYIQAHFNSGNALRESEQFNDAANAYRVALELQPLFHPGWMMLGVTYNALNDPQQAKAAYQKALSLTREGSSERAATLYNLGNLHLNATEFDEAVACYQQSLLIRPHDTLCLHNYAQALVEQGEAEAAVGIYQTLSQLCPENAAFRVNQVLTLPAVYLSEANLQQWRERYTAQVDLLLQDKTLQADPAFASQLATSGFYLGYQGLSDVMLQRKVASLFRQILDHPPLTVTRESLSDRKPRVGFISRHFAPSHTIGRLLNGVMQHLSRDLFDVFIFSVGPEKAYQPPAEADTKDTVIILPMRDFQACQDVLHAAELDIAYFTDIGMDVSSYLLAQFRFAPVQCTTWGHPVSSGSANMDYFIACESILTDTMDEEFSETLVPLNNYPFYYTRPVLTPETPGVSITREHLGVGPDQHLYACLQSLFKLTPDTDDLFADILRGDPQGLLVLLRHPSAHCTDLLLTRFSLKHPDVADRVKLAPRLPRAEFLRLMAMTDVLLDSIHFSGGNTSYEGLAFGTPIVTLATPYLKGRLTVGLYNTINVLDCIADTPAQYVDIAVQLGTNPVVREALKSRLLQAVPVLYENIAPVRELEQFFLNCLNPDTTVASA